MSAIRAMVGCQCCGGGAANIGRSCTGPPAVVRQPDAVCARMPFTTASAAEALSRQSVDVQRSVRWLTPPDIARLAATYWPHDVIAKDPSTREENIAREAVQAASKAAEALGFRGLANASVRIGWSAEHLPRGPAVLPEHTTVDDLVLELAQYRAAALFSAADAQQARWPDDPSDPEVTFAETEQALYVPLHYLSQPIPAVGMGALARSIAAAVAGKIRAPCQSERPADTIARIVGDTARAVRPMLDGPVLKTNDTIDLGPLQFFYIGAAASDGPDCRIGHGPDPLFAQAFSCRPIPGCAEN